MSTDTRAVTGHQRIETSNLLMIVLVLLTVLVGGLLYLGGMLIMAWNTVMTVRNGRVEPAPIPLVAAHA